MSIILGIDPGSIITGYGIISYKFKKINYISSGFIQNNKKNFLFRTNFICKYIEKLLNKFKPDYCAIEKAFISYKNINSGLKLSQLRGAILLILTRKNIPIFEYSTCSIKKSVSGTGKATKIHIKNLIKLLLNLSIDIQEDESDALATAITFCKNNIF